jgi:adenylosuccinate synthase
MLRHAVRLNSLTELAVTKLDVLDTFETIRICVGYRIDGNDVENYPDLPDVLHRAEPVYVDLEGWQSDSTTARMPADLPPQAQAFIRLIEEQVGVPVRIIGVGAERDDYVLWGSLS